MEAVMEQEQAQPDGEMTPEDALVKAREVMLSDQMVPMIEAALNNAKDVATAAATIVFPIVLRMMQETDVPDDELLGSEEGDGIAVYLLQDIFEIAEAAGIQGADDPQMAQRAVELVADLLAQSSGVAQQGQPAQPAAQQRRGLLYG